MKTWDWGQFSLFQGGGVTLVLFIQIYKEILPQDRWTDAFMYCLLIYSG